jgi:hypothetical protein
VGLFTSAISRPRAPTPNDRAGRTSDRIRDGDKTAITPGDCGPRPQAQVSLFDEAGHFLARPDFYYPLHRLALEYDGAYHRENLTGDNRRQNRLVDAGYRLLRFSAADVLSAPESIVALVRRALSEGTNQSRTSR